LRKRAERMLKEGEEDGVRGKKRKLRKEEKDKAEKGEIVES
jgi:hypothetical protein